MKASTLVTVFTPDSDTRVEERLGDQAGGGFCEIPTGFNPGEQPIGRPLGRFSLQTPTLALFTMRIRMVSGIDFE